MNTDKSILATGYTRPRRTAVASCNNLLTLLFPFEISADARVNNNVIFVLLT